MSQDYVKKCEQLLAKYEALSDEQLKVLPLEEKKKIFTILRGLVDRYLNLCEEAVLTESE